MCQSIASARFVDELATSSQSKPKSSFADSGSDGKQTAYDVKEDSRPYPFQMQGSRSYITSEFAKSAVVVSDGKCFSPSMPQP